MEFFSKIAQAFEHGGFWMWPIAAFQLFSVAIVVERTYALFMKRHINQTDFVASFEDNVRRGEMDIVISKAQAASLSHPVAKAIVAGATSALNFGGRDEIQGKMDEVL